MSHGRVIARNGFWTLFDTIVAVASTLVGSIAVARALGPDQLGYYNYALWIANATGSLVAFGVPVATRKYAAEYLGRGRPDVARAIIRATLRLQIGVAAVAVGVGATIVFTFVPDAHRGFALLAVLTVAPSLLLGIATAAIAAAEDVSWNVRASIVGTLVNVAGVALALVWRWGLPGLTAALLVSRVIDAGIRFRFVRRVYARLPGGAAPKVPDDVRRRMLQFCWLSTALLALDVVVWDRFELVFLERFADIRQVAFYSIAFNVVQNMLVLPRVLAWSMDTTLQVQQGRAPETVGPLAVTAMRFMVLFAIPAAFGLAALAEPIVRTLYGDGYAPAARVLTVLALLSVGKASLMPAQHVLVATERQGVLLTWGLAMAALNVLGLWWLVPSGGAVGAALSKGIVQIVAAAGIWGFVAQQTKVTLPWSLLGRLVAVGAVMHVVVRAATWSLSHLAAILVGLPLGLAIVLVLLRWLGCVQTADRERLLAIERMVPRTLRAPYGAIVRFVRA